MSAAHKLEAHGPIPWKQVVSCANIWLLSGAIITMTAMSELLNSWYPTYLQQARGASPDAFGSADHAGAASRGGGGLFWWLADRLAGAEDG